MPTGAFHSLYWQTQAPVIPPAPGVSGSGGYPNWQVVTLATCLLLMLVL